MTTHFDWEFLYQGMRWQWVISNDVPNGLVNQPSWGIYEMNGSGQWYDPNSGRTLQPQVLANGYDPAAGETGFKGWFDRDAGTIAAVSGGALGIVAAVATGGLATAYFGAGLIAAGAAGGFAGGAIGGGASSYASGASGGQVVEDALFGGLAGAAGGAAGAWAAPFGQQAARAIQLQSGIGEGIFAGAAGGFAAGAVEGGYNGYRQTKTWYGLGSGALIGGIEGGFAGGALGGVLGALSGRVCFVAGTRVVIGIEDDAGNTSASGELQVARGGTIGELLSGHHPDSMIHLTMATEAELATATFPQFNPPHLTPGVFQGSSWVKLSDVAHMTVPEFQELVVGPAAAGHTGDVTAFVVSTPGAAVFEPVNVPNLANITEFTNPAGPVVPSAYVPLRGK